MRFSVVSICSGNAYYTKIHSILLQHKKIVGNKIAFNLICNRREISTLKSFIKRKEITYSSDRNIIKKYK